MWESGKTSVSTNVRLTNFNSKECRSCENVTYCTHHAYVDLFFNEKKGGGLLLWLRDQFGDFSPKMTENDSFIKLRKFDKMRDVPRLYIILCIKANTPQVI